MSANLSAAAALGLLASFAIERLLQPRPRPVWKQGAGSAALHSGLWLVGFSLLTPIVGRPWFAMAVLLALLLLLVMVNNAKWRSLREPFVFQDYDYFVDALRHPRLYIPFLGWGRAIAAALGGAAAIALGLWAEERLALAFSNVAGLVGMFLAGAGLIAWGHRRLPPMDYRPEREVIRHGFLPLLWVYGMAHRRPPGETPAQFPESVTETGERELPNLVAVQSESFFDPRALWPGIRPGVFEGLDRLGGEAVAAGPLEVPAWGANTVRSEFAFLTGIPESALGVHRFNPYRAIGSQYRPATIASYLKQLGYRTVCVHPYPASFYDRARVYPLMGFDEFIDIGAFSDDDYFGPYVSDEAVAEKVRELVGGESRPLFVFVITMENHGPLHLESVNAGDREALYETAPPAGCEDLTVYLRHLNNANQMAKLMAETLEQQHRPAWMCWYGDHVPIMPEVYDRLGTPEGRTRYFLWGSDTKGRGPVEGGAVHALAEQLLGHAGLLDPVGSSTSKITR